MFLTWKTTEYEYDADDREIEVVREHGVVVPDCCSLVRNGVILLRYDLDAKCEGRFDSAMPRWVISIDYLLSEKLAPNVRPDISPSYCPYCATRLPGIRRRADPPSRIHRPVEDGDYCGTCHRRTNACSCWSPEVAWETVGPE